MSALAESRHSLCVTHLEKMLVKLSGHAQMNRKGKYRSGLTLIITVYLFLQGLGACNAFASCPDLSLMGLDQKQHNLCEYIGNGKWTIVNIWGPKCPACIEELPELVLFHDAHYTTDATVLGIALDFPSFGYAKIEEVTEVVESYLIDYPNLLADGGVSIHLGAHKLKGTPTNLVFNPNGELVFQHVGIITKDILKELIAQ